VSGFAARAAATGEGPGRGSGSSAAEETPGLAHVATVSFLASRATPPIGFFVALAGGVALARIGQLRGGRWGYGASVAAMLQTVAIIGPVRFGVPLTQALTAPLLGVLEARGVGARMQMLVCGAIRLAQNALTSAFVIVVLTGLDVYLDSYDTIAGVIPLLPEGRAAAWTATVASLVAWAIFASAVQVWVYRRGLHGWPRPGEEHSLHVDAPAATAPNREHAGRFDPRAVALAAASAFALLVSSISWALLAAVAAWLVVSALAARGDRTVVPVGAALALVLATVIFTISVLGGQGLEDALARGARAALLVLVATWLRAAAGTAGLREVSRRALGRLRRAPAAPEAALVMNELGAGRELGPATRSVLVALRSVPPRLVPLLDAVLGWVAFESRRFTPPVVEDQPALHARAVDVALVVLALAPLAVLVSQA
jgi:hypothetical protein